MIKYLDLTFPDPESNLACDEALVGLCENSNTVEILRFWEPHNYFVVVGYSNRISSEVNLPYCQQANIPVLRRFSGGGAVLQGPRCLNYSLIVQQERSKAFSDIVDSFDFVIGSHREALERMLCRPLQVKGISDIVIGQRKFSGNAQHRKRRCVLVHGTFLLGLDLSIMENCLLMPARQPPYRANRSHEQFVGNLEAVRAGDIRSAIREVWRAFDQFAAVPYSRIQELVRVRYSRSEWNFRF